ncbi:RNA-directed DNA polymerase [Ruegeria pomeroyi]|nr:RNA-directed DNA polymerase [Ruegeria pomeroyi]
MPFSIKKREKTKLRDRFPVLWQVLGDLLANETCYCASDYNSFTFKARRSRKSRTIDAPCPHLKALQRQALNILLAPVVVHEAAMAFAPGKSIAMNARCHLGATHLYSTDIRSFFTSVSRVHVKEMLATRVKYLSVEAREEILDLVTWNERLPQGAPTSPHIANLVMFSFDELCTDMATRVGATYTRYADDISISSTSADVLLQMQKVVNMGLGALGMEPHPEKTRHLGPNQTKLVTGLDIGGSHIRPTRAFRKKTTALVRMSVKYPAEMEKHQEVIFGYLAFWYDVDPGDPQLANLLWQMGQPREASRAKATRQKQIGMMSKPSPTTPPPKEQQAVPLNAERKPSKPPVTKPDV